MYLGKLSDDNKVVQASGLQHSIKERKKVYDLCNDAVDGPATQCNTYTARPRLLA